jgi:hypothetical protein
MHRKMMRSLEAAGFDGEHDSLIFLGDLADGRESREVLEFVSALRSRTLIFGNHEYALRSIMNGATDVVDSWLNAYGGRRTCWSYKVNPERITLMGTAPDLPLIRFDDHVVSGRELLQRIFPPHHLALLDEMIPFLVMKQLCPGHDALLCHAGLTEGVAFSDHDDRMWTYGDRRWYERAAGRNDPPREGGPNGTTAQGRPITIIYGHWHQASHPAFSRRRIGLAMLSDVAVMSIEERVVWVGDDTVYRIEKDWIC